MNVTSNKSALATEFQAHRTHLAAVAYRILGSVSEAEDAVQETWLRLSQVDVATIDNFRAWLTTVVARICLDIVRRRHDEPLGLHLPDPIVSNPEDQAVVASSVGLALQVVIETLKPAERIAFVLHDVFGMPFDAIAPVVGRSPAAARQLASRARRRVRGYNVVPDADLQRQREIVDAFYAAARRADYEGLLVLLDPDVVVRADFGVSREVRGAHAVAEEVMRFAQFAEHARPALVNGAAGAIASSGGRLRAIVGFSVVGGRIVEIDILADPKRLSSSGT